MFTKTIAVATTLAVVASAQQLPPLARRDFVLEARQTTSVGAACETAISSVLPLYSEIPTPPEDLLSISLPADPCETPALTGTIASEYSSYTEEVLSWYTSHSAELLSALADCTELAAYATQVPVCSSYIASAESSASKEATATETGAAATETAATESETGAASATKTAGSSASSVATAGAARETGFVAGLVAAGAILGAVVAL